MRVRVRVLRLGFSIPEMLAIIAIIVILISLLMPTFHIIREIARNAVCKSQQRQLSLAFLSHTVDNANRLPGCYAPPYSGPEVEKRSWMGIEAWGGVAYEGAVVKYVGNRDNARKLYRCPSLKQGTLYAGNGSNGFFDYTGLLVFTGASRRKIPTTSEWADPVGGGRTVAPTPIIVEEDPANYVNSCCVDPGHANIDRTGTWHMGGGNYMALDSHSERLAPLGPLGPTTWDWYAKAPSGATVQLSSHGSGWGGWDSR